MKGCQKSIWKTFSAPERFLNKRQYCTKFIFVQLLICGFSANKLSCQEPAEYSLDEDRFCLFEFTPDSPDFVLHQVTVVLSTQYRGNQKSRDFELLFPWETPVVDSCREISSGSLQSRTFVFANPYIISLLSGSFLFSFQRPVRRNFLIFLHWQRAQRGTHE